MSEGIQVEPDEADMTRLAIEQRDEARAERDKAYRERAALVAYLSAVYPSVMLTDSADPDWPIVFVSTPSGQMSWHIAATDTDLFQHVPATTCPTWDGHTTDEKYQRLRELTRTVATGIHGPQPGPGPAEAGEASDHDGGEQ